ncbi:hypothetical protein U9M48_020517, partial [Paspalum notatum var. saurae]
MEMPTIVLDDEIELINLVAFEQSVLSEHADVMTSYVPLMGMLIHTAQGVSAIFINLLDDGIFINLLDDDEEVARFFNQSACLLCHVHGGEHVLWLMVAQEQSMLMRDYFASLWSAISRWCRSVLTATQMWYTSLRLWKNGRRYGRDSGQLVKASSPPLHPLGCLYSERE